MLSFKIIVGLGNPTLKYYYTRHNLGAFYINLFCKYNSINLKKNNKFFGDVAKYNINNHHIWLLIPNIFMNQSGISVYAISKYYNISLDKILVIHDELDLLPGVIKLKYSYGHNGHNGLRNIISKFNSKKKKFCRMCIGIGRPKNDNVISSFVLEPPTKFEKNMIIKTINNVIREMNILLYSKKYFINSKIYNVI